MSRSGYTDDCNGWDLVMWRGAVNAALKGARGQKLLRDLIAALDAMPVKRLISGELVTPAGEVCALGSVAVARKMDVGSLDAEDRFSVARAFDIAPALAAEIAYMNDEYLDYRSETPEERFDRIRRWAESNLTSGEPTTKGARK